MTNEAKYTRKMFLVDMLALDLTADQRECAEKWLAALEKKSSPPRVNKKRIENETLAEKVVETMKAHLDTMVNAKWISEHVAGILTAPKASAVVSIAIERGQVERYTEKGRTYYKLV